MAEIFYFKPKRELQAAQNINSFIDKCKNELTVFGSDLNWDHWEWKGVMQFTKLGAARVGKKSDSLDEGFINFAKAYFRYQQGHRPTGAKNEKRALKSLESALLQFKGNADISGISISVLDEAAKLLRENYARATSYHGGRELERLAKFLTTNKLITSDVSNWKNPITRKKDEIQTGKEARTRREKKLPSTEALNALAEIFANGPQSNRDIFSSSTFAMLMCAPSRITEVLELPVDCEIEEKDSKGTVRYGWRFYSGKGYGGDIKWIPTEMVSVAKEAVKRIKSITEEGRDLAKWIENNPDKFYRHKHCPEILDHCTLTEQQIAQALGWKGGNWRIRAKLKKKGAPAPHTLNSLWQFIMGYQPKNFPWLNKKTRVKYSNALFCMTTKVFGASKVRPFPILWVPTCETFNNDLSPRESLSASHKSIFDRYGYLTTKGDRLKVTSHQARHLLNTIAQRGGLSNLEIAKWSGRADAKQNRVYNHMTEYEMVAQAEELDKGLTLFGPVGEPGKHPPISIQEFNTLEKGPVHVTEYGICVHDYTLSPCEKFRDCINCSEQVCIKGNDERFKRIKSRLEEVEKQYQKALQAMKSGLAGADRWYEYHKNTLKRLRELIGIFDDPTVENGTLIKLKNDKEFSPLRRAVASRLSESDASESKLLGDMANLLGGGLG